MYLGFESLTLRHRRHKLCIACDDFLCKNHPALTPLFLLSPKSLLTFRGPRYPVTKRFSGLLFFVRFRKIASKPPQEQPDFRKELRLFCDFKRIRTVKLTFVRHRMNFRSIYCRNSPFRATPFRLPLHLPRTTLTSSQGGRKYWR